MILLAVSCRSGDKVPEGIYTKQQVADFLMDLYLLEARIKELRLSYDSSKMIFELYEPKIFEQHQFDDSIYRMSFQYYLNDPKALSDIYSMLTDSLSLRERIYQGESAGSQ